MSPRSKIHLCTVLAALGLQILSWVNPAPADAQTANVQTANVQSLGDIVRAFRQTTPGAFNSLASQPQSLAPLKQWQNVVPRASQETKEAKRCAATADGCATGPSRKMAKLFRALEALEEKDQIIAVNSFFNELPYLDDRAAYGVREKWATPAEFIANAGDCEDYAIAKYFVLRAIGFSADRLRIVALVDTLRGSAHAVLTVKSNNENLVLDNTTGLVLPEQIFSHYQPLYSFNEYARWLHFENTSATRVASNRHRPGQLAANLATNAQTP